MAAQDTRGQGEDMTSSTGSLQCYSEDGSGL